MRQNVKPTQEPVPSSDIKNLFFNSGLLDIWATSLEPKYIDRFGNCHLTAAGMEWIFNELVTKFKIESEQALLAAGYAPAGTFQEGAEVVSRNGTVLWKLPDGDGDHYRWDGDLPKQVPAGSTPQSTGGVGKGAWVSVGDASLRGDIGIVVKRYSSVSNMSSDASIKPNSTVRTMGYYKEDDGGGAVYYISEGAGDGYTSHSVGDGLVAKIIGNHINILQAGVKDGADCYENIVSAFTNFTSVDCSVPYYINTSKPVTVSPRRLKELQLKAISPMDKLFSTENMYNKVILDCRFDGNNLANICFYGDNGANTNKIDGLFAINGITHGIYYKNAYLASIRNFYARNITNGIGVYLSLAHNMKLERGEAHYCKYGIVVDSGASLNIDTIDSSYNTEADLIVNTQAPSSIKNWYSEHSKGDMLRVGGYYSMVSIEDAFLEMKDSTGGAIVIVNSANAEARLIDATNVNIANAKNPFRKLGTSGVSNFIFSGKFDNVTDIDYSFAVQASVNGADIYRNGSLVFAAKGFNWDIGDIQIGKARVQYYQKTFSSYMDKIVFSEREAANSAIAVKVFSDKGAGTAFVMDGSVVSNGMPSGIVVQTNGNYVQLLNQNNNGVITKLICEVTRIVL